MKIAIIMPPYLSLPSGGILSGKSSKLNFLLNNILIISKRSKSPWIHGILQAYVNWYAKFMLPLVLISILGN